MKKTGGSSKAKACGTGSTAKSGKKPSHRVVHKVEMTGYAMGGVVTTPKERSFLRKLGLGKSK